jgi:hypothetical protein
VSSLYEDGENAGRNDPRTAIYEARDGEVIPSAGIIMPLQKGLAHSYWVAICCSANNRDDLRSRCSF